MVKEEIFNKLLSMIQKYGYILCTDKKDILLSNTIRKCIIKIKCTNNHNIECPIPKFYDYFNKYEKGSRNAICRICHETKRFETGQCIKRYITTKYVKNLCMKQNVDLRNEYINANEPLELKCLVCNYEWKDTFHKLDKRMKVCTNCSGTRKLTLEEVKETCLKLGKECLSTEYKNIDERLHLRCIKCRYEWKTNFDKIKNEGTGCPRCAKVSMYSIEEMKDYCESRDIIISNIENARCCDHLNALCKICNHIWTPTFSNIKNHGKGCPKCNRTASKMNKWCEKHFENNSTEHISEHFFLI